jgi:riboflavin kinase/FMN adenylyltransferase
MLTGLCERYGIGTEICPEIHEQGVMVSSTVIRGLLAAGEVDAAAKLLGRPFELTGRVVHGDHRGRSLGFPTANMQAAPHILIPGKGVYAVRVKVGTRYYNGLCNVGTNPTFLQGPLRVETHILDFDREIYGKPVTVLFIGRLRSEKTFASAQELIIEMNKDLQQAREKFFD